MIIDVTDDGLPENIKASYCSERKFKKPSLRAAKYWQFYPAIKNGKPVPAYKQTRIFSYQLADEDGRIIPDKHARLIVNGKADPSVERLCMGPKTS